MRACVRLLCVADVEQLSLSLEDLKIEAQKAPSLTVKHVRAAIDAIRGDLGIFDVQRNAIARQVQATGRMPARNRYGVQPEAFPLVRRAAGGRPRMTEPEKAARFDETRAQILGSTLFDALCRAASDRVVVVVQTSHNHPAHLLPPQSRAATIIKMMWWRRCTSRLALWHAHKCENASSMKFLVRCAV